MMMSKQLDLSVKITTRIEFDDEKGHDYVEKNTQLDLKVIETRRNDEEDVKTAWFDLSLEQRKIMSLMMMIILWTDGKEKKRQ